MTRARRRNDRPRHRLATVGLIVEGETEFAALPLLHKEGLVAGCPPLKPTNLGGVGSHLDPVGIARMVTPKVIAHIAAGRTKVIVCIDREQRADCSGEFAQRIVVMLRAELAKKGYQSLDLHVVIADRTFESWLLADARGLYKKGRFKTAPKFQCFEGNLGSRDRKGVVELSQLLGRDYGKTTDGPSLFRHLDFAAARLYGPRQHGSKSLDKLLRVLGV